MNSTTLRLVIVFRSSRIYIIGRVPSIVPTSEDAITLSSLPATMSQEIVYIWKVSRPANENVARALMRAAYHTAIQADPKATQVLIR